MKKDVYKLTTPQMSIYLTEQFTTAPINNLVGTMYFKKEEINLEILKQAVNLTVETNQALRTHIFEKDGKPMQYFKSHTNFDVKIFDFSSSTLENAKKFQQEFIETKIELLENDLFEFIICIMPTDEIALMGKFHHIVSDAWSLSLVINHIATNYSLLIQGLSISDYPGEYTNFIEREDEYLYSETYLKNKEFWNTSLENLEPITLKNKSAKSFKADRLNYEFSLDETKLINDFCKKYRISAYVLFLAILDIYLYRFTSYDNFTIQTPILNRLGKEKNTMGMFINMLSIQMKNNGNKNIIEFLQELSTESISQFKNSKYPYLHLLEDLRKNNNVQNYNIVYSFQNMRPKTSVSNIISYRNEWNFVGYMQDELVLNVTDLNNSGTYNISYDYLTELYTKQEIEALHTRLCAILFDILAHEDKTISKINILPQSEKTLLLETFNNTDFPYDKNITLIDLFEKVVEEIPDNLAVIYRQSLFSYRRLNNVSNVIANKISSYGIKNKKIAVLCKKSAWMIAALLGIMKSGNCYIPIDPVYPDERIKYIMKDSNCEALITSKKYKDAYSFENTIIMDELDYKSPTEYKNQAKPSDLAYMIYTSGTTGKPKGVKIKHENIINTLLWRKDFYKFNENITTLQVPSFAFDSSVEDIFTSLISGAKLIIPSASRLDINIICEEIVKNKVNHFLVVPSLYKVLLHEKLEALSTLKFVTIAGEHFPDSLCREHFEKLPNVRLINEYGPTENSVCSTCYELTKDSKTIFIGKPIYNCKCYILDKNLELLPIGAKGELYVTGPGVSDGYLNKPELTSERFIKNPFDTNSPYLMYKTGDIVTQDFSGNLEFIGRDDGQVKLNGFRIELKEIERNILKDKNITDAIALIRENTNQKQILVAYVTSYKKNIDLSPIYEELRRNLPFYMIPIIMQLDEFPLTPNGKIDKNQLPTPTLKPRNHTLPKNEIENEILIICRDVLGNEQLGVDDDLFTVGNADSLSILTINSRLFAKNIKVRTQDFYKFSTIERLAHYISIKDDKLYANHKYIVKPMKTVFDENISKNDLHFNYKNILLTGVTGFLGIHILDYLLKHTNCSVYCIIRKKYNQEPLKRLENLLEFYYDSEYYNSYKNRIIVLEGELSKENFALEQEQYSLLQKEIDCIINTAAITKHYGSYSTFEKENVLTVKNLITFAKSNNAVLNHMSTTNVSGNYLVENSISYTFTENDFYIGQNYEDNVYICSKFEAEKLILEEEYKGLKANIFRLGNLMARISDGVFQKNKFDNAYYTRLLALAQLGYLPEKLKHQYLEFSPIDETAEAIIKLLTIPNLENTIFHIFSDKLITIQKLLDVFNKYNISCKFTDYESFIHNLHLQKNEKILKYIISDLNYNKNFSYDSDIIISQRITKQFLDFVDFKWSQIDENYLDQFFTETNFTKDIN